MRELAVTQLGAWYCVTSSPESLPTFTRTSTARRVASSRGRGLR
ncbi:hypothetical protein [Archangium violaceum]|nr:hypothetical protein [Archangium violaceum]